MKNLLQKWNAKMSRPKMRLTIAYQVEYEPDLDLYDTKDPVEMALADEEAAGEDPEAALRALAAHVGGRFRVKVQHIESAGETGLRVKE